MKTLKTTLLLLGIIGLSLTACDLDKEVNVLSTSDSITYVEGMCYQASRSNIVESVFLINAPINPDDDPANYKYDLIWNDVIRRDNFRFVEGLEGKSIMSLLKINDHTMKITFDGAVNDSNATFGYIRVSPSAFSALSERATDRNLYAYIALGETSSLVDK